MVRARGRGGVKLVLEMVTVSRGGIEWTTAFLFNLWSFFSLVSLFLTCRIIGGHSFLWRCVLDMLLAFLQVVIGVVEEFKKILMHLQW